MFRNVSLVDAYGDNDEDGHYAEINFVTEQDHFFITNLNDYYQQQQHQEHQLQLQHDENENEEKRVHQEQEKQQEHQYELINDSKEVFEQQQTYTDQTPNQKAIATTATEEPTTTPISTNSTTQQVTKSITKVIRQTKKCRRKVMSLNVLVKNLINGRQRIASDGFGVYHRAKRRTTQPV